MRRRAGFPPLRAWACAGALTLLTSHPALATGWFRPPDEVTAAPCVKASLAVHAGTILRTHVRSQQGAPKIRLYIEGDDGQDWIVFCDGRSGSIEKSIRVDDLDPGV